jgi:hypothetical protein
MPAMNASCFDLSVGFAAIDPQPLLVTGIALSAGLMNALDLRGNQ